MQVIEKQRPLYFCCLLAIVVLFLVIIWLPRYSALCDYPGHLVRAQIMTAYDLDPWFQKTFQISWAPKPNMAVDYVVPLLLRFFDVVSAGKIFLSIITLLFVLGCHLLGEVAGEGHPSWTALLVSLFAFHSQYQYGFVNSSFSLALFLVVLAFWWKWGETRSVWRWTALAVLVLILFVSHLIGFVFFGLAVAVATLIGRRRIWFDGSFFAAPVLFFLMLPKEGRLTLGGFHWGLSGKLARASGLVRTDYLGFDLVLTAVLVGLWISWLVWDGKRHRWMFIFGIAFMLTFAICPSALTPSGGWATDARFVPPAFILLTLSMKPEKLWIQKLALAAGLLLVCRAGLIGYSNFKAGEITADIVALTDRVEPYKRISPMFQLGPSDRMGRHNLHAADYSIYRSKSFVSGFFVSPGAQPLTLRKAGVKEPPPFVDQLSDEELSKHTGVNDYILSFGLNEANRKLLLSRTTLLDERGNCALWKVH